MSAHTTGPPPAVDLGGATVHWLADIPRMRFARGDLLPGGAGAPDDTLELAFGGHLVTTPDITLLVDAGVGDGKRRARPGWHLRESGALPAALRETGRTVGDVDLVHLTHLHADHVGWNTSWDGRAWRPTFPRARYQALAAELDWAAAGAARDPGFLYGSYEDSVRPLLELGLMDAVPGGHRIGDGIEVLAVPGHTPGSSVVVVRGTRDTAVISGDLIHHPSQFADPATCSRFCQDAAASARARARTLRWIAAENAVLMPAHFGWGRVAAGEGGRFRFTPA